MGIAIQRRRGTTSQHGSFTGKAGEITVDITKWVVVVHDGSTVGGFALARENHSHSNATDSTAGFMSAADKTKLDSISGGTINYQTIQSNGSAQTQRTALNLTSNFAVTDDGAGNRTSVDLADSGVGAGTYTKLTVNTKGRVTAATLLAAGDIPNITSAKVTDFASAVQNVRLDQMASPTADVSINSHKLINVADPVSATDAATKQYVDTTATGLTFKAACRAASSTAVTLAAPGTTIGAVTLSSGDRVLLKDQNNAWENGIYVFNGASTPMTRALDANSSSEVKPGMFVLVTEGSSADVGYVLATDGTIVLDSTSLSFVAFSSGGGTVTPGNGINVSGSTVSVKTADATRIAVSSSGVDLATISGLTPGQYSQFTVDAYGRITATTGATFQPLASNLTSLASLSSTGFAARIGSGSYASRTLQPGTGINIVNGDGVSGNVQISVVDAQSVQKVKASKNGTLIATRQELNFIEGSGVTLTVSDNTVNERTDVTIDVTGGGGGAPATAQYVVLSNNSSLTNERVLIVGSGILLTDGGANGNVTLALQTDLGTVP